MFEMSGTTKGTTWQSGTVRFLLQQDETPRKNLEVEIYRREKICRGRFLRQQESSQKEKIVT
jgi:hypothetical protein